MTTPNTSGPVRELIDKHVGSDSRAPGLEQALTKWASEQDPADAALALAIALAELEPLEDPAVELIDPDDPEMPAYEGLASLAWRTIAPGDYQVSTSIDGQNGILRVTETASAVISPPVTVEAVALGARFPNPSVIIRDAAQRFEGVAVTTTEPSNAPVQPAVAPHTTAEQGPSVGGAAANLSDEISDLEADEANPGRIERAKTQLATLLEGQFGPEADALRDLHDLPHPSSGPTPDAEAATAGQAATGAPAGGPANAVIGEPTGSRPAAMTPPGMRVTINGNLATEPTYGLADSGRSWARLRVASNERVRSDNGALTDAPPTYTEVVLFGVRAENAVNSMQVGDPVIVKGRPEVETFTRRDGSMGAAMKVFASSVTPRTPYGQPAPEATVERAAVRVPAVQATLHHTPTQTVAVGVARDNKVMQSVLKDNGFKWSAKHTAWYLPASMPLTERDSRVAAASMVAQDRGLSIGLSGQPAPAEKIAAPESALGGFARDTDSAAARGVTAER
ncbi:MAG: single-stranded DNA-binding protein [Actinomycetota bacterium]|nr:single-stranded DNA-binding protein [Actinomycetota bacterium]